MGLTLIVDGDTTPSADTDAIKRGFESIDPGTKWSKAVSLVELCRDESHSLTVSGHPLEGWGYLEVVDGDRALLSFPKPPLAQAKAIEIVQAYHRGADEWMSEFQWDEQAAFKPTGWTVLRNLAIILGGFAVLVFLFRWIKKF